MEVEELLEKLPPWLRDFDYSRFLSDNYVVCDFETTILDKGSPYNEENRIICSSYKLGRGHPNYKVDGKKTRFLQGNEFGQSPLCEAVELADFWVAHNTKFEYGWLERCGLPLDKSLAFCTQLAEYVLYGNRCTPNMLNLDACLRRRRMPPKQTLGSKLLKAGVCPSTWPEHILRPYSLQDSDAGEKLFLHQRKALIRNDKLKTLFTRAIFTPVLVDIEKNGMHLDPDRTPILQKNYNKRLGELEGMLSTITNGANPNSPKQMVKTLYEDLKFKMPNPKETRWWGKDGKTPTTSFDYINLLTPKTKKQERFKKLKQEHSKVNAALTKSLTKFANCISETDDQILTASLNQTITVTQRLSSSGKNYKAQFQNFPRIFKPLFRARNKGWKIVEIDQAQLEYRVAVWYGQDQRGLDDILNKVDSHAFTATEIYGISFTDLETTAPRYKELRTDAKAHTFKPLYGGESGTADEKRYYAAFKEKHCGITAIQNEWKASAVCEGKVTIPSGLTFYFPNTRVLEDGYITNSTNICNYPVQSLATADIVPIGVTYQWHLMRVANLQSFLINTIHDSSLGEVPEEELEMYGEIGKYAFVDVVYEYLKNVYDIDFNVPLEAETSAGTNWGDTPEWREKYLK